MTVTANAWSIALVLDEPHETDSEYFVDPNGRRLYTPEGFTVRSLSTADPIELDYIRDIRGIETTTPQAVLAMRIQDAHVSSWNGAHFREFMWHLTKLYDEALKRGIPFSGHVDLDEALNHGDDRTYDRTTSKLVWERLDYAQRNLEIPARFDKVLHEFERVFYYGSIFGMTNVG